MEPPLLRAVVLRTRPYSETSLWVRLYSESHGKLSGISKGARRGSQGIYTPFLEIEARGYPPRSEEGGLWTLPRPDVVRDWRELVSDPGRLAYGFALLELVDITLADAHPQPDLYASLTVALDSLVRGADRAPASLLWFLLGLCTYLGYALQHEICPRCDRPLVFPVGSLNSEAGGVLCRACSPPGRPVLAEDLWELLVVLAGGDRPPDLVMTRAARDRLLPLVLAYLSYHLDRPLRLRSLDLLPD